MFGEGNDEIRGMIPRAVEHIFNRLKEKESTHEVAVVCSFLEIYNDQIRDLGKAYLVAMGVEESTNMAIFEKTSDIFESIAGKRGNPYFAPAFHKTTSAIAQNQEDVLARPGLKEVQDEYQTMNYDIREDADGNVFVKDLSLVPVTKLDEVIALISAGVRVRATHETKMNATSSRSHTVFTVTVVQKDRLTGTAITGMLNLVDLAGSERIKKSESQGIRLKEALHINSSLSALGKVVTALDPSSENTHVPYRDSKLTRVLQNSLGGNSYTVVLAAIHPHSNYYEECLSTLQFANRCRNVRNNPRINYVEDNEDKDRKIRRLQEEIQQLRQKISQMEGSGGGGGRHLHQATLAQKGPEIMKNLITMLKKAGIEANISNDGGLMLNGQKISPDDLGLAEGSVSDSFTSSQVEDSGSVTGGGDGGRGASGGGGGAYMISGKGGGAGNQKMKKIISELQDANSQLQAKLKDRKVLMDEQGRQIQEMSNELTRLQTNIRHKEYEYKQLSEEKERALAQLEANLKEAHGKELDELVANNRSLQQLHQTALQNAPESFKVYGTLIKKVQESKASFEGPLRQEFEKHLLSLEKTRVTELSNIKTQYEYWLQQKDKALEEFVAKFNSFREKKAEQLRMCENEIVRLFAYTEQIESILDGVEKGKYRVQQRQGHHGKTTTGVAHVLGKTTTPGTPSGAIGGGTGGNPEEVEMGAVVLPKGLRPINPLKDETENLELTKRIVGSHKQRQIKLEKMKEEAFHRSLQAAARSETIGTVDPVLQQQIRDLLVAPGDTRSVPSSNTPPPPTTTTQDQSNGESNNDPATGNADASKSNPQDSPIRAQRISSINESYATSHRDNGNASATSSGIDNSAYVREIEALKAENEEIRKQNHLSLSKISDQLSSHEMIVYLRSLEGEIEKQRRLLKDQSAQLQNLKVANTSLTRMLEKQAATVGRPRTALG